MKSVTNRLTGLVVRVTVTKKGQLGLQSVGVRRQTRRNIITHGVT